MSAKQVQIAVDKIIYIEEINSSMVGIRTAEGSRIIVYNDMSYIMDQIDLAHGETRYVMFFAEDIEH